MKHAFKRLMLLCLVVACVVAGVSMLIIPRIVYSEADVFRKLDKDHNYGTITILRNGSSVKFCCFRSIIPIMGESSGEIFAVSDSGKRMKRECYLKPVFMVTNIITRVARDMPDENAFFDYLSKCRW